MSLLELNYPKATQQALARRTKKATAAEVSSVPQVVHAAGWPPVDCAVASVLPNLELEVLLLRDLDVAAPSLRCRQMSGPPRCRPSAKPSPGEWKRRASNS